MGLSNKKSSSKKLQSLIDELKEYSVENSQKKYCLPLSIVNI